MRGQINARHGWRRRPPRAWCLRGGGDTEVLRFFYTGYDFMLAQRRRGHGVRLMPVPPRDQVEARYPTTADGFLRREART